MHTSKTILALQVMVGGVLLAGATVPGQVIIYVDDDASNNGDGTSWSTAYRYLQDALADAASNGVPTEIHVAQGKYKPDHDEGGDVTPGDREATFQLLNNVALKGGYAGLWGPDPDWRDIHRFASILSGDLYGNDVGDWEDPSRDENSYHVTTGSGTDQTAAIDGFTVTAGNAYPSTTGGGMLNSNGSPTLTNCVFSGNRGPQYDARRDRSECSEPTPTNRTVPGNRGPILGAGGAGVYNACGSPTLTNCIFTGNWGDYGAGMSNDSGNPTLIDCTFSGNSGWKAGGMFSAGGNPTLVNCTFIANWGGGPGGGMCCDYSGGPNLVNCRFIDNETDRGAGICNQYGSSLTLTGCTFSGNSARGGGGGMHNWDGSATLTNCVFDGNSAGYFGGGAMCNWDSSLTVSNCIFTRNSAEDAGGGIYIWDYYGGDLALVNCTFAGNSAPEGRTLACDPGSSPSDIQMTNCILWNGGDEILSASGATITVSYSDVQGGWLGEGNIDTDPLFVAGPAGCYYLSQVASGQPNDSPCVDAGTTGVFDPTGQTTRTDEVADTNGVVDMGYHYPVAGAAFGPGDCDYDGDVDLDDYADFESCLLGPGGGLGVNCDCFDLCNSGDVDLRDFAVFQDVFTGP